MEMENGIRSLFSKFWEFSEINMKNSLNEKNNNNKLGLFFHTSPGKQTIAREPEPHL